MRSTMVSAAVAAGVALLAVPAHAQMVTAKDPQQVMAAAKEAGLTDGKIVYGDDDDPYIEMQYDGLKTLIFFMNCDQSHKDCKTLQYYIGFSDAENVTVDKLNTWNRDKRFGHAFVDDEGDPVLEMDMDLDFNGLPKVNVVESFNTWKSLVEQFHDFLYPEDS